MKLRSLFRILFLCLLPSAALLVFAATLAAYATRWLPDMPELGNAVVFRRLGWTGIWVSVVFALVGLIGHWLSPAHAEKRARRAMPALLRDLIRYGIFAFCVALILHFVWGESVTPIFGALGIGGVVLGFALQETLSNFFAGLALLLEQPFGQGDWIRVGDRAEGEVEHITWRATKIRTRDNDYEIFPNSVVAKEVILNYRQPSRVHAIRVSIGTSYDDPPDKVKRALLEIAAASPKVLPKPEPIVYLKSYADFSINYELKCFIEDYERRPVIEDDLMHRIWYTFRRHGIDIPFPIQTVFEHRVPYTVDEAKHRQVDVAKILSTVPILKALGSEQIELLTQSARVLDYGRNELVIRQGDAGDTLFAIVGGTVRVSIRAEDGSDKVVARLSAGEVFGEMSLLTGDPRTATVTSEELTVLVAVSKEALLPILTAHPEFAEKMAETVTLRKQGLDKAQAEAALDSAKRAEVKGATQSLGDRIRKFFRL